MNIFECPVCQGNGEEMVGAWMRPNPSWYGDYEEVWGECRGCGGSGRVYSLGLVLTYTRAWLSSVASRWCKEDPIPF